MKSIEREDLQFSIDSVVEPEDIENVIYSMMVNPNISSINYFNDFSEGSVLPGIVGESYTDEVGLVELDGSAQCLAIGTHALHHHLENDPKKGIEILIARAVRRMLCMGATPFAVSAMLYHINFADPKGHSITSGAREGLENAAKRFNLKVSEKKIRFDRFVGHGPVTPTVIISMTAIINDRNSVVTHAFKMKGSNLFILGRSYNDISSSEYLEFYHGVSESRLPLFNIDDEVKIQKALRTLHKNNLIRSAIPVGKGGLFFTLLRAAIPNELGFDITTDAEIRLDAFLFGESMGRIVIEVDPLKDDQFVDIMSEMGVPFFTLGHITKGEMRIDDKSYGYVDKIS